LRATGVCFVLNGALWQRKFVVLAIAGLGFGALSAQTAQTPQAEVQSSGAGFTLSVTTRLVVLDVVVTDKQGHPVTDLKRSDFRVYEDGVEQQVRTFEAPSAHALPAAIAASSAANAVFDPARPLAFGQSPVTVLLLDQLNTKFADTAYARRSMTEYLNSQPALLTQPTTLFDLYDGHLKQIQPYTRDRNKLLHALNAEPPHNSWSLETFGASEYGPLERLDQSLRALEQIAGQSARIPGRKNLIWVGTGFSTIDPQTLTGSEAAEVRNTIQHVTDTLLSDRITFYATDPKTLLPTVTEITDPTQLAFFESAGDTGVAGTDFFNADESFDMLGPVTGGRVVRGLNDIGHQIDMAVQGGETYYSIGYAPTSMSTAEAKFRKIRVECVRPGLTMVTRSGYFAEPAGKPASRDSMSYDLSTAAESPTELNALRVSVKPEAPGAEDAKIFDVTVGAKELTWTTDDKGVDTASVEILLMWFDAKHRPVGHVVHAMLAHAGPNVNVQDPERVADFDFVADAVPKKLPRAVAMRFVVRDKATGRMGTFDAPVR
jgi:VWFA-related protein